METNSNIPAERKIVSVEILHLDELGYGPQGKHTRREWRAECLKYFQNGQYALRQWQDGWEQNIEKHLPSRSFGVAFYYDNGFIEIKEDYALFEPYSLDLTNHTFADTVYYSDHEFNQSIFCIGVVFKNNIYFSNSVFKKEALFNHSKFQGRTGFSNAKFEDDVNFSEAEFEKRADFDYTIFERRAILLNSAFADKTTFKLATFKRESLFIASLFLGHSDFENAIFENVGHFERALFFKHTPAFRGCKIDCTRLEFSDDSYFPQDEYEEDAVKNISFLKRLSEEHGQTDQALNFNAMELRAKRKQVKPKPAAYTFKLVTLVYETVSDFGRSFTKPLQYYIILLVVTFYFAIANAIIFSARDCENEKWYFFTNLWRKQITCAVDKDSPNKTLLTAYRAAGEYTIYRAAGILDFSDNGKGTEAVAYRLFGQPIEPWWMRIWGVFKANASTALLFLAALGLRNKYRIK